MIYFPLLPAWLATSPSNGLDLPFSLLLVFGSAKLLGTVFERLGQPGLIGEILAGVLLGPSVCNWVQPSEVLHALAEMGVMFLLFRVGLEVKAAELMQVGKIALGVAVLGVIVPFGMGWAIMAAAGVTHIEAIFVGAALVATSVGITAQVLASKGLLQARASRTILAAAVIDDVLGLLVLALVSSMAEGRVNLLRLAGTGLVAGGFTFLVALYGTRTLQRVVPRIEKRMDSDSGQFHLALVLLFALSWLAVFVGVAAIVGAFLAGMALSETVDQRVHHFTQGVSELLVPFFLVAIGLQLELGGFRDPKTIVLTLAILAAAVVSKFVGCGLGAWKLGRADMLRVGVGMVPRGEVGMVVAQIGLGLGVIEKPVYAVVVAMAVGTTLIAPPLLKLAYKNAAPGDLAAGALELP